MFFSFINGVVVMFCIEAKSLQFWNEAWKHWIDQHSTMFCLKKAVNVSLINTVYILATDLYD